MSDVPRKSKRLNPSTSKDNRVDNGKKDKPNHLNFLVFNPKLDMEDPQFELGFCFPDAKCFREAVRQHSIVNGRYIKFWKNEKNKVQVKCKHESCDWLVYASKLYGESTFHIKTINAIHACNRKERVTSATSNWLAKKYNDKIRTDPRWPVNLMMQVVQKDCKLLFSTTSCIEQKRRHNN